MNRNFIFNSLLLTAISISAMHDPNAAAPKPTLLKELKMSSPSDAAYTSNGKYLVAGSTDYGLIVYDTQSDYKPTKIANETEVLSLAMHPDNIHCVTADAANRVKIWNIETAQSIGELTTAQEQVLGLKYNADGSELLIACDDTCEVWDLKTQKQTDNLSMQGTVWDAAWNPVDNNYVAATYGGGKLDPETNNHLALWDTRKAHPIIQNADVKHRYVGFNNNGTKIVATSPLQSAVYDAKTAALIAYYNLNGKKLKEKLPVIRTANSIEPDCLQFMPEGDVFVTGLMNAHVTFTDLENDECSFTFRAKMGNDDNDNVTAVAIRKDGKALASSLYIDGCIKIWDISKMKEALKVRSAQQKKEMTYYTIEGDLIVGDTALEQDGFPIIEVRTFHRSILPPQRSHNTGCVLS